MPSEHHKKHQQLLLVSLTALGVVYGDIGTSPLYALRECFRAESGIAPTPFNVFGVLSLILWSLVFVVGVKYLLYVMRADNRGEGGILALLALVSPAREEEQITGRHLLIGMGLFGAALLYGDGMITPAISVLSAVEGLRVATPMLSPYIVPVTVAILVALFWVQKYGTAKVGTVFGPVMLLWFSTLAALGIHGIVRRPEVLAAIEPIHAIRFFQANGWTGFAVLGSVFLVATGGEALYADMGHFGRKPIRLAWFTLVLPALLINYFGQGALLLERPSEATEPFYHLAPNWALYPLVALATLATVIASQAVISGAFSLTWQAVLLGDCPRMRILHTSQHEIGQIYIPFVNWALMIASVCLVVGFGSSSSLAGAYGVAVSTTMWITTLLAGVLAYRRWHWGLPLVLAVTIPFLTADLSFFFANLLKFAEGGWFPLVVGGIVYLLMSTWREGRKVLGRLLRGQTPTFEKFLERIQQIKPCRIRGTAVFMTSLSTNTPPMLWHHLKHNQVLHKRVVLLTLIAQEVPFVPEAESLEVIQLNEDFYRVVKRHGFLELPQAPPVLARCAEHGLVIDLDEVTYYIGRETLIPTRHLGMPLWRDKIFEFMSRNAARPTTFYQVPSDQVVELGIQVEI